MTKEQMILKHLKRAPITPIEALHKYGCFRLSGRIYDLRRAGHDISMRMVQRRDRNGRVCKVAEYRLI